MSDSLPPGQRARADFPRFGLTPFAFRFPKDSTLCSLAVSGDVLEGRELHEPFAGLPRVECTTDFHCVTTWTRRNLRWGGVRFADFYRSQIEPLIRRPAEPNVVVLRGQDGYRTTLPLADLLAADVLLADCLEGEPLSIEHGAPLRLIAPSHYGYKSVKHLSRLELWQGAPAARPAAFAFMDHPRARVAEEERGRWLPGWLLRYIYRPLIGFTVARFSKAMATYEARRRSSLSLR